MYVPVCASMCVKNVYDQTLNFWNKRSISIHTCIHTHKTYIVARMMFACVCSSIHVHIRLATHNPTHTCTQMTTYTWSAPVWTSLTWQPSCLRQNPPHVSSVYARAEPGRASTCNSIVTRDEYRHEVCMSDKHGSEVYA